MGTVIIVGGGVAGLEAAGHLARLGYSVTVAEKNETTGGNLSNWYHLFPNRRNGTEVTDYLRKHATHKNIRIITSAEITRIYREGEKLLGKLKNNNQLEADAVIIATGFEIFDSRRKEEYGYGIYDNVITSADLEKMFREGKIQLKNGKSPARVGFVHCVGSRDEKVGNLYCSKLCCVTAVKQAIEIREKVPGVETFCFYMDMRMGGAYYEELYREAQETYGVNFIRGKVSEISVNINGKLIIKAEDTLTGRPLKMELDMVVLMAGMEMPESSLLLAKNSHLKCGENRYFMPADSHFGSNLSGMKGVFYAGCCVAPMNVTESISHARAAVSEVVNYLKNHIPVNE
ncbi:MAG: FAD-dependent oxidoreductase [Bacteroidales bacterium]